VAAVEIIEEKRKSEDFFGHRNRTRESELQSNVTFLHQNSAKQYIVPRRAAGHRPYSIHGTSLDKMRFILHIIMYRALPKVTKNFSIFETEMKTEILLLYTETNLEERRCFGMIQPLWVSESRKIMVCIDDYDDGVLKGRFYHASRGMGCFQSLSQFLLKMESVLEEMQEPQSYTSKRTFSSMLLSDDDNVHPARFRKGAKATFELQVLFRQHSSWQGVVVWKDRNSEQSFRSVLELVFLLDSALRDLEGSAAS